MDSAGQCGPSAGRLPDIVTGVNSADSTDQGKSKGIAKDAGRAPGSKLVWAGLGAFVALTKAADFPGKDVLLKQKANGVNEKLIAFRVTQGGPPPRPHYGLFHSDARVGEVTSGAPSPKLGIGVGLAYVLTELTEPGTILELEVRGTRVPVEVVKKPFYKRAI